MKLANRLLILVAFLGFTATLNATILYETKGSSVYTLIDSGGMVISASSSAEPPTTAIAGTGIASIVTDMQTAPGLVQQRYSTVRLSALIILPVPRWQSQSLNLITSG